MAQVIGNSQAWNTVKQTLQSQGLTVKRVEDIQSLLERRKTNYEKTKHEITERFDNELLRLSKELEAKKGNYKSDIENCERYFSLEIELFRIAIQLLKEEPGFFRKIINNFKIREHEARIRSLKLDLRKRAEAIRSNIKEKERAVEYKKSNRENTIEAECKNIKGDILLLEQIRTSPELAGAIAELDLIEHLKKLPSNFYIISGITIVLDRAIRFDGEWLKSAQIDHLVISPVGVFVIETKSWSREFTEHGNYFDPYQQVKRASYACYKILGSPSSDIKVRSIIAYRGIIPNKPKNDYTKALHIDEVNNYILWYKENMLSDTEIQEMISDLRIWSKDEF